MLSAPVFLCVMWRFVTMTCLMSMLRMACWSDVVRSRTGGGGVGRCVAVHRSVVSCMTRFVFRVQSRSPLIVAAFSKPLQLASQRLVLSMHFLVIVDPGRLRQCQKRCGFRLATSPLC